MRATYAYDVVLGQLERAHTQADVDAMLREYDIYIRGQLEAKEPAAAVTEERIAEIAHANIGWLLGEISHDARARVLPLLPKTVRHPILGRDVERKSDQQLLEAGARNRDQAADALEGGHRRVEGRRAMEGDERAS